MKKSIKKAVAIGNDTPYGLSGYIQGDPQHALRYFLYTFSNFSTAQPVYMILVDTSAWIEFLRDPAKT